MGGSAKGLLPAPGGRETLIARLARVGRDSGLDPILVGAAELGDVADTLPRILDREPHVGPLSGLASLLDHARNQPCIAMACDMPRISSALLTRLIHELPSASVLAPRDISSGKWEPLCARYDPNSVAPALRRALDSGVRSFQDLFRELSVVEFTLSESERTELHDWDTPEDIG